jgi:hypothetical protein
MPMCTKSLSDIVKIINIHNTECLYVNIFHHESTNINLNLYKLIYFAIYLIKFVQFYFPRLYATNFWKKRVPLHQWRESKSIHLKPAGHEDS